MNIPGFSVRRVASQAHPMHLRSDALNSVPLSRRRAHRPAHRPARKPIPRPMPRPAHRPMPRHSPHVKLLQDAPYASNNQIINRQRQLPLNYPHFKPAKLQAHTHALNNTPSCFQAHLSKIDWPFWSVILVLVLVVVIGVGVVFKFQKLEKQIKHLSKVVMMGSVKSFGGF